MGMVFKKTDNPALLRRWRRFRRGFAERTNKKFVKAFERRSSLTRWSATHYLPVEIMAHLERKGSTR